MWKRKDKYGKGLINKRGNNKCGRGRINMEKDL